MSAPAAGGVVRAVLVDCPSCGSTLAQGIMEAWAVSDENPGTTCPECPGSDRQPRKVQEGEPRPARTAEAKAAYDRGWRQGRRGGAEMPPEGLSPEASTAWSKGWRKGAEGAK